MNYDVYFTLPDERLVDEIRGIEKGEILNLFNQFKWDEKLDLVDKMGPEKIHHATSMTFDLNEGSRLIQFTASRKKTGEISFCVELFESVPKSAFFGLLKQSHLASVESDFTSEDAFQLLELFVQEQYDTIQKVIQHLQNNR